ncbi:hypothetical protein D3C85_1481130 [compost metagenome]
MNINDLFTGEHLDAPPGTVQALLEVLTGFFFAIGLKLDDMETFLLGIELFQPGDQ